MRWELLAPSLWGMGGALCWAGPQLTLCIRSKTGCWICTWEFVIAIFAGALFAPAFGPMMGYRFHWLIEPQPFALWTTIGLAAYPSAPLLIKAVQGRFLSLKAPAP